MSPALLGFSPCPSPRDFGDVDVWWSFSSRFFGQDFCDGSAKQLTFCEDQIIDQLPLQGNFNRGVRDGPALTGWSMAGMEA